MPIAVVVALGLSLGACTAPGDAGVGTDAPPEFAARQLAAVGLTVEDFGSTWSLLPDDEGTGGGPETEGDQLAQDPCTWVSEWVPDLQAFATHSWRMYTAGDDATYASDWLAAASPGVDLVAELAELRDAISACRTTEVSDEYGQSVITFVPDIGPVLGDAAFSYRAEFAGLDGTAYGEGEVHTVVCGPLWLHLSYVGYDPFVERETLLPLLVERASELGGC